MTPFYVGMKVVCVDDGWISSKACTTRPLVRIGDVLTISKIKIKRKPKWGSVVWLWFDSAPDGFYNYQKFRPAHESRIEELRSLLVTPPVKKKERVAL